MASQDHSSNRQNQRPRTPEEAGHSRDESESHRDVRDLAQRGGHTEPHDHPAQEPHEQHARKGQAESPRELTLNQPPTHQEGHEGYGTKGSPMPGQTGTESD